MCRALVDVANSRFYYHVHIFLQHVYVYLISELCNASFDILHSIIIISSMNIFVFSIWSSSALPKLVLKYLIYNKFIYNILIHIAIVFVALVISKCMYLLHFNIEVLLFQPDYTLKIRKIVNIFIKVTIKKKTRGFGYTCTELMGNQWGALTFCVSITACCDSCSDVKVMCNKF